MSRITRALALAMLVLASSASPLSRTVEISPGVHMPRINLGTCCGSTPSTGLTPWLANGGVGIDTAWDYSDQTVIGALLKQGKVARADIFVTTKIPAGFGNASDCNPDPSIAVQYVQENLRELGLEYVDLVLLHAPCQASKTPVADADASNNALWTGLQQAMAAGATRAIGVSNYNRTHLEGLTGPTPALNQCEMSLTGSFGQPGHDEDTIRYCAAHNITYESYGALKGCPFTHPTVVGIAAAHSLSAAQLCLRWILQRGAVVATGTGANGSKAAPYAVSDMAVYDAEDLTDAEMDQLNKLQTSP